MGNGKEDGGGKAGGRVEAGKEKIGRPMENLEYSFTCGELQKLVGSRLENIYRCGPKTFRLKIGKSDLLCTLGCRLHETKYVPRETGEVSGLVELARSRVRGGRVEEIRHIGNDRLVEFSILGEKGRAFLVFEMFGKGNLLVLDSERRILGAWEKRKWRDRELLPGKGYLPPPSAGLPVSPSFEEMGQEIEKKYAVAVFSKVPVGLLYVREALARAGVSEKESAGGLSEKQIKEVLSGIEKLRLEKSPCVYLEGGKPVQFSSCGLSLFSGFERNEFPSLSEAADEYYFANPPHEEDARGGGREGKREKLLERIKKQEEEEGRLIIEERESAEAGKKIYENFERAEEEIRKAREKKERKAYLDA